MYRNKIHLIFGVSVLLALSADASAQAKVWQPSPGHTQIAIWPGTPPGAQSVPGPEVVRAHTDACHNRNDSATGSIILQPNH